MDNNVFVILGAGGGIGSAVARRLAQHGAKLLVAGRSADSLGELATQVGGIAVPLDARNPAEVAEAVKRAESEFGGIDGIVNCVGSLLLKPAHVTTDEEWNDTIATNLTSAFAAVRAGARSMRKQGGSIVLVSSAAAQTGLANHEAIAAAKAGVIGLTRSAAATYAPHNIRVNAVAPGLVRTPLTARLTANETAEQASVAMHALGRLGSPDDVASAILFLLDSANSWVTGQILGVDGGLGSIRPRG
ncbi:MAG: SDR family oxidoreductase [Acidimicrobiia bacterium]|nr:SDR family oxidoreductase [Acidimicrobiia bacterium]MBT8248686.1 SDR family oxidoreductase [Acidimicrobiia bacterium]NNC41818.1 SDR family oxidoreductase [Acidimicrobiia bacterium]NNL26860.1 SDR family oxidoreductase [Acidimicrobiia bacterium]NNL47220.1 SDR family oxidoreductase [Acidimicrobiia bacterium]